MQGIRKRSSVTKGKNCKSFSYLNVPSMSNTMPRSGGAVLKEDKSAVARKGANLLGPGEAMADRSRRRMKAASVSIG